MRKSMLCALAVLLVGHPAPAQDGPQVVEEIIVKVNGDIITRSQFREMFEPLEKRLILSLGGEELQQQRAEWKKRTFNSLINELVVRQRAEERGIRVSDEYFRQYVENLKKQIGAQNDAQFRQALAGQGQTLEDLRRQFEHQSYLQALFGSDVGRDLYRSESRLQNYYEENVSRYTEPARLRLSQIVFPLSTGEAEQESAAQAVLERLRAGEDFDEVYRSVTPQSAPDATGDIGFVDLSSFRPELAGAVSGLEQGAITGVVRTESALLILKVTEREPERVIPLEEIKERVTIEMQNDTMIREMGKYITRLKKQSLIQVMAPDFVGLYEETFFDAGR